MENNGPISVSGLQDVPETLLYPLIARYVETKKEGGIIKDPKSVEILDSLDYDVRKARLFAPAQIGVCFRTMIFDEQVLVFLKDHPEAVVVNLGCGLDTRFPRVDNGRVLWFDLDLPAIIELRKNFFAQTERHRFITASALDPTWLTVVPKKKSTLIIAEGLSMYFTEEEIKTLLKNIKNNFPGAGILMEVFHPFIISLKSKWVTRNPMDTKFAAFLKWGVTSGREMDGWGDGTRFVNEWYVIEKGRDKFPWLYRVLFALLPSLTKYNKVIYLQC